MNEKNGVCIPSISLEYGAIKLKIGVDDLLRHKKVRVFLPTENLDEEIEWNFKLLNLF